MKFTRVLVILMIAVLVGMFSAGSVEAAQKPNTSVYSYRVGNVINGFSISFIQLLRLWRTGHARNFFD